MPHSVTPVTNPRSVRVLTYNASGGQRLDVVLRIIRETRPDLAAIQELMTHRYRGWTWDQAEGLAQKLAMDFAYQRLTGRNGVDGGLAVLSTGQIEKTAPIRGRPDRPTGLSCRVRLSGRAISVAAVHFISVPRPVVFGYPYIIPMHYRQMTWALERLKEMGGPALLVGDLNTIPGTPVHRLACRHLVDVGRQARDRSWTRRTLGLPARIDYIFASPHFTSHEYRVLPREGSDHRPVVASLQRNDDGTPPEA